MQKKMPDGQIAHEGRQMFFIFQVLLFCSIVLYHYPESVKTRAKKRDEMMNEALITLRVPATSANLGSGFDALGMALSLYNVFKVTELLDEGKFICSVVGEGAGELSDASQNMTVQSYLEACRIWNLAPRGFRHESHNVIPLCRGLGSSSTAVTAGVLIARALSGRQIDEQEALRVMTLIEGHPDNVVPCCLGGMTVSCWDGTQLHTVRLAPLPEELQVVAAVPAVRVRTHDARRALPKEVPFSDAVFNLGRAALLCAAWASGQWEHLSHGMEDRLHQPYRARLFPGGAEVIESARRVPGCIASAISGSGPTIIAVVREGSAAAVGSEMCRAFSAAGAASQFFVLQGCANGAQISTADFSV